MNFKELQESNRIILQALSGSKLYGTDTPESDTDIRGIFINPVNEYISLFEPSEEIIDTETDTKYFGLKKFFKLLTTANPNILELLYLPKEAIFYKTKSYDTIVENRDLFLTKSAFNSYVQYALGQVKKAKGVNKKANRMSDNINIRGIEKIKQALRDEVITQEWVELKFNKNFFSYLIKNGEIFPLSNKTKFKEMDKLLEDYDVNSLRFPMKTDFIYYEQKNVGKTPFRFVKKSDYDYTNYSITSVEHLPNTYRLYKNGKGILEDNQFVCTSMTLQEEIDNFERIIYFNEDEYSKAKAEYNSFWEWMANRNEERYKTCWNEEKQYDCKNLMHCVRLLFEAESIFKDNKLIVRFEGDKLQMLKDIRAGKYTYEEILKLVEDMVLKITELKNKSNLPNQVNMKKLNELYSNIINAC